MDDLKCIIDNARDELVERLTTAVKEEAGKLVSTDDIVQRADVPSIVRHAIDDHFRKAVANEIGNRLRCGIYDGTSIDKLFESVWKPELDKAIQDRIRDRVDKTIDTVIAKRLKQLWPG